MERPESPYIAHCGFCEQGLLRFAQCQSCDEIVAMCDECDLIWSDIAAVSDDPSMPASGTFPTCPECETEESDWTQISRDDVESADLAEYIASDSL